MAMTTAVSSNSQLGRSGSLRRERRLKAVRQGASRAATIRRSVACCQSSPFSTENTAPIPSTASAAQ